jgi:hypothetical protein
MPFVLVIIGTVLLVASVKNTYGLTTPAGTPGLGALLINDFTGANNFVFWFAAILIIGAIGYIDKLKPISNAFLFLVIIVLFLKQGNPSGIGGGFFSQFTSALQSTTQVTPGTTAAQAAASPTGGLAGILNTIPTIP